jgi:hypothetical protein
MLVDRGVAAWSAGLQVRKATAESRRIHRISLACLNVPHCRTQHE